MNIGTVLGSLLFLERVVADWCLPSPLDAHRVVQLTCPQALRTHMFRCLGPKTILCMWLLGYLEP